MSNSLRFFSNSTSAPSHSNFLAAGFDFESPNFIVGLLIALSILMCCCYCKRRRRLGTTTTYEDSLSYSKSETQQDQEQDLREPLRGGTSKDTDGQGDRMASLFEKVNT